MERSEVRWLECINAQGFDTCESRLEYLEKEHKEDLPDGFFRNSKFGLFEGMPAVHSPMGLITVYDVSTGDEEYRCFYCNARYLETTGAEYRDGQWLTEEEVKSQVRADQHAHRPSLCSIRGLE